MQPLKSRQADTPENPLVVTNTGKGKATETKRRLTRTKWLIRAGLVVSCVGIGLIAWHQQWVQQAGNWASVKIDDGMRLAGLTVQSITVRGRDATAPADVLKAIGAQQGDIIFDIDIAKSRRDVEALGWVRTARISRLLPDRLHIEITERIPFRRWQMNGRTSVIDRDGEIILRVAGKAFAHLPRVVGPNANLRATEIDGILDLSPRLKSQVITATLVRNRRWDIGLQGGLIVRLPEQGPAAAWLKFAEYNEHENLLNAKLQVIDMRVPGQVHVRMPGGRVRKVRDRGT